MNLFSIFTMIIVLGIVWGGLSVFLFKAAKYEKLKEKNGEK
jgi:hypothetical protein